MKWISAKDRLPKPGERVIATNGKVSGEAYIQNSVPEKCCSAARWQRYYGASWDAGFEFPVTHWMPLPNPPENNT